MFTKTVTAPTRVPRSSHRVIRRMPNAPPLTTRTIHPADIDLAPRLTLTSIDICPDDILTQIFLDAVIDEFGDPLLGRGGQKHYSGSVWQIAAVCIRWRRLCLDYASLWAYIVIRFHRCAIPLHGPNALSFALTRITLQLARSKEVPLYLDLDLSHCYGACGVSMFREIAKECHRWRSISYFACKSDTMEMVPSLFPPNPDLSQLYAIHDAQTPFPFTHELPSLRRANVIDFLGLKHNLPLKQLTRVQVDLLLMYFPDLLSILSQCIDLVHLEISRVLDAAYANGDIAGGPEENTITFQNLTSLDITHLQILGVGGVRSFLLFFHAPELRTLMLGGANTSPSKAAFSLSNSLTRLDAHIGENYDKLTLLRSLPHLESLVLRQSYGARYTNPKYSSDIAIHALLQVVDGTGVYLCPFLRELELVNLPFDPVVMAKLMALRCSSDNNSAASLKMLRFRSHIKWEAESRSLREMLEEELMKKPLGRGHSMDWFIDTESD